MDIATVQLLGVLLFAAITMSIAAFALHRGSVAFASTLLWLVVAIWNFAESSGAWNIYMILGFVGIVMMIVMPIEAMFLNKGEEAATDKLEETSAMQQALEEMDAKNKDIAKRRSKGMY